MMKKAKGFTLIELLVTIVIFGVIVTMAMPMINLAFTFYERAKRDEAIVNSQKIASGLMAYARNDNMGRLPMPYSGGDFNSAVFDPNDTSTSGQALAMELRNAGVPLEAINTDGSPVGNVRVYQMVSGLEHTMPFYGTTGTDVNLIFDVGVLTLTQCPKNDACNSGVPGESATLTASNVTSWYPEGTDYGSIVISTLSEQKAMLRQTAGRVNKLSDRLSSEFYTRMRLAAADNTANHFPLPTNAGAPAVVPQNPLSNMGCFHSWLDLGANNVNVLAQIGLDPAEFGFTAWGGSIQYCSDFDMTASDPALANQAPHYAALRINRNVSLGSSPTAAYNGNVVITF